MVRFSVLIPVYNVEMTLNRCVDSVLGQGFEDYEIILIDDGSSDQSGYICDQYAIQDGRIKVLHQNNRGLLEARRVGIKSSNGQFCVFLDSDDWLECDALETIDRTIDDYDCDVVMYNYKCITDTSEWIAEPAFDNGSVFTEENRTALCREFLRRDTINSMWTKAVKRVLFDDDMDYSILPRRVTMGEDALQSIHIYRKFEKLVYTSKPLHCYYINDSGITRTVKPEVYYLDCNIVFEAKLQFMLEIGLNDDESLSCISEHYMTTLANYLLVLPRSKLRIQDEMGVYLAMRTAPIFGKMLSFLCGDGLRKLSSFGPSRRITKALSLLRHAKDERLYAYLRVLRYYDSIRAATMRLLRNRN